MKKLLLPVAVCLLFVIELLRIWFIMPFPGSQEGGTVQLAWFMDKHIWWMRIILYLIVAQYLFRFLLRKLIVKSIILFAFLIIYGFLTYFFVFRLNASTMFREQSAPVYASVADNKVAAGKLVIGVEINGEAKAYPIEIIGYHHQVRDIIGREEIMVTYCTVCRSGRVFLPIVEGTSTNFTLIGMDKYNAIFEDEMTGSWWQQATGTAIAGKLKGTTLNEVYAQQMTLQAWLINHPDSKILQADDTFLKQYGQLTGYDEGTNGNELENRNTLPWQDKSWVAVVQIGKQKRAYDWAELEKRRIIMDTLQGKEIAITLAPDNKSFYAFERRYADVVYNLYYDEKMSTLLFDDANRLWDYSGKCQITNDSIITLHPIPVYQEFYHAYKTFGGEMRDEK